MTSLGVWSIQLVAVSTQSNSLSTFVFDIKLITDTPVWSGSSFEGADNLQKVCRSFLCPRQENVTICMYRMGSIRRILFFLKSYTLCPWILVIFFLSDIKFVPCTSWGLLTSVSIWEIVKGSRQPVGPARVNSCQVFHYLSVMTWLLGDLNYCRWLIHFLYLNPLWNYVQEFRVWMFLQLVLLSREKVHFCSW